MKSLKLYILEMVNEFLLYIDGLMFGSQYTDDINYIIYGLKDYFYLSSKYEVLYLYNSAIRLTIYVILLILWLFYYALANFDMPYKALNLNETTIIFLKKWEVKLKKKLKIADWFRPATDFFDDLSVEFYGVILWFSTIGDSLDIVELINTVDHSYGSGECISWNVQGSLEGWNHEVKITKDLSYDNVIKRANNLKPNFAVSTKENSVIYGSGQIEYKRLVSIENKNKFKPDISNFIVLPVDVPIEFIGQTKDIKYSFVEKEFLPVPLGELYDIEKDPNMPIEVIKMYKYSIDAFKFFYGRDDLEIRKVYDNEYWYHSPELYKGKEKTYLPAPYKDAWLSGNVDLTLLPKVAIKSKVLFDEPGFYLFEIYDNRSGGYWWTGDWNRWLYSWFFNDRKQPIYFYVRVLPYEDFKFFMEHYYVQHCAEVKRVFFSYKWGLMLDKEIMWKNYNYKRQTEFFDNWYETKDWDKYERLEKKRKRIRKIIKKIKKSPSPYKGSSIPVGAKIVPFEKYIMPINMFDSFKL
jgi:hypothetical protein